MNDQREAVARNAGEATGKTAEVTPAFWIVKICATTVDEAGLDPTARTEEISVEGFAVPARAFAKRAG